MEVKPGRHQPGELFSNFCAAAVERLPLGLSSVVAPTFLGFAIINGSTFAFDLVLLTALHGWLDLPLSFALSAAYVSAFAASYILNRILNFRSHASVATQVPVYVLVVCINFVAFILGMTNLLTYLGATYLVARILAGGCEAVFMYSAMRWIVFRR